MKRVTQSSRGCMAAHGVAGFCAVTLHMQKLGSSDTGQRRACYVTRGPPYRSLPRAVEPQERRGPGTAPHGRQARRDDAAGHHRHHVYGIRAQGASRDRLTSWLMTCAWVPLRPQPSLKQNNTPRDIVVVDLSWSWPRTQAFDRCTQTCASRCRTRSRSHRTFCGTGSRARPRQQWALTACCGSAGCAARLTPTVRIGGCWVSVGVPVPGDAGSCR